MRKTAEWTAKDVRKEVHRLDPKIKRGSPAEETAMLLLASLIVGANTRRIGVFLGIPSVAFRARSRRLRRYGIWQGENVAADAWFEKPAGNVAFWLDCAVADGYLRRTAREV